MILKIIIVLFSIYLFLVVLQSIICKNNKFILYVGLPGTGKSTTACSIALKDLKRKKKKHVLSNFFIKGTEVLDLSDIGNYDLSDSTLILDEAGMDFDNRQWKSNFSNKNMLYLFKHHRHYNIDIFLFSQTFDIDCKLLALTNEIRILKKSFIPFFVSSRAITKVIDINKETGELINRYKWVFLSRKLYFMPKTWKYFNSYVRIDLPEKIFDIY